MNDSIEFDPSQIGRKWVAYFDLLGFGRFVCEHAPEDVFSTYLICLEEFRRHESNQKERIAKIEFLHFSDSFLMYAPDDTASSLAAIESASRWFFNFILHRHIPLRGALACDEFYADRAGGVIFGKALVESSKLGERFNWIGFILCPSAIRRMADMGLPAHQRLNYREWFAPTKMFEQRSDDAERTVAYLIGASAQINNENIYIPVLESMAKRENDPEVKAKYLNTIHFLKHFGVIQPVKRAT